MNSRWITSSLEHNGMFSVQEGPATILGGGGVLIYLPKTELKLSCSYSFTLPQTTLHLV